MPDDACFSTAEWPVNFPDLVAAWSTLCGISPPRGKRLMMRSACPSGSSF